MQASILVCGRYLMDEVESVAVHRWPWCTVGKQQAGAETEPAFDFQQTGSQLALAEVDHIEILPKQQGYHGDCESQAFCLQLPVL
jgi:hypothetical protein